jgi:hypothetical protein
LADASEAIRTDTDSKKATAAENLVNQLWVFNLCRSG